ncbi:Type II secretory pathway, component PulF [Clostridium amylolyticum]|uniref:Type II secretory pathway, component PulF n=1 Tax=Clostridium amylolyticum TaxID=1121298 RepID=A0A1M6KJF6_9CLOT|nr:type II secretion system F family protein [Clostridium amylolyticum]SHJ58970.1 Type II secretory pathway, component PulF [Clostridium amylolyticum]
MIKKLSFKLTINRWNRLSNVDLDFLFYNIALLTSSGVTLLRGVEILTETVDNTKIKKLLYNIHHSINLGSSLSEALSQEEKSDFYVNLIKIGEETGSLENVLYKLSAYYKEKEEIKKKIIKALIYPIVVLVTTMLITIFILFFLLPNLFSIMDNSLNNAPWYTKIIFNTTLYIKNNIYAVFYRVFLLGLLLYIIFAFISNNFKLISVINTKILSKLWQINILKLLELLLASGCSIQNSFNILIKSEKNPINKSILESILKSLAYGNLLSFSLKQNKYIEPIIPIFISLGEESGNVEKYINLCCSILEKRYYEKINKIISIIQPVLIMLMGCIILTLIYTIFMPLLNSMYNI